MNIVVIGSSGAIGKAVVGQMLDTYPDARVFAVSRQQQTFNDWPAVQPVCLDTTSEDAIVNWLNECKSQDLVFHHVVCTTGILHDEQVQPEKRLEDVSPEALHHYFQVNTVLPMLWIKHLVGFFPSEASTLTVLSARVGSIEDNGLGGWYGYRASKAALNMLVKTAAVEYKRRAKHTSLICYHPGTVDSQLSAPFQRNVKPEKLFTAQFTAQQLVAVIQSCNAEHGPYFVDWANLTIPW
ncbi:SDR family NAD(P)-dependent oxidoreductase [Alteromonas lipolytica]|uniref:Short-chain dehydrogenase n=1 Tax=Alteromonas lipolytica TaxID=1856405 RepID=A0A1E8FC74_9ALTE|nr:SDR family NAD(P)-dependent oxidoreductase [Alteromonas lipolytica]OFI33524.1 short-chain dehydrogenase [Alteromonas lipolytica]GGF58918.1 SDR family oxidoreductase [Alteromonas lipolytica]